MPPEKEPVTGSDTQTEAARPPEALGGTVPLPAVVTVAKTPPPPGQPKGARRRWLWAAAALLAVLAAAALYFQPWAAKTGGVGFETVAMTPATRLLAVNGRIAAAHSVELRPLVSGTLAEVSVVEGDAVTRGTALARIDPSAQEAAARQAAASLDSALVAQEEAQANFDRARDLGQNVPQITLENAARTLQTMVQEVARMTALFDAAQIRLADFTISAPIAGTVLTLNVDPGQSVDPSTHLMTIADLSVLEVKTDVDEAYATQIRPGQRALLQLAGQSTLREGRVRAVSQRVDAATGGLEVTLAFADPVTAPVALTVTANIIVETRDAAITLPRAAVVTTPQGSDVFVVERGIARPRPVQVIDWPAARLIVTDGLSPGDTVITDATGITAGQTVTEARP